MITALLFILGFAAIVTLLAWPLVARLDRGGALTMAEHSTAAFLLGCLALSLAVSAVGGWRLDPVSMGGLCLAAAAVAAWNARALPWRRAVAGMAGWGGDLRRDPVLAALAVAVALTGLSALLQGMAPPNDYDSLMYHLALPQLDVERGRILPAWDRGMPHVFFPALTGNLSRLVLALVGERPVQMLGGLIGMAATLGTYAVARRVGLDRRLALLAALLFVASRAVVWEMATPEVEVPLAATTAAAVAVLLAWGRAPSLGLMVLCGLLLGAGMLVKMHGGVVAFCLGLAMLWAVVRLRHPFTHVLAAAGAAALVYVPHAAQMLVLTGNPLYPMFNGLFGGAEYFTKLREAYGIGRQLHHLVLALWPISTDPMTHFDGMVLGAPYFLALVPLALMARERAAKGMAALAIVAGGYYVVWFWVLSQQVRFLMPIFPILAVWAAMGAGALLRAAAPVPVLRVATLAMLGVVGLNQALFVGIYAALRLPPALGLVSPADYHSKTPTLTGAHYASCQFLRGQLQAGERVLSLLSPHSYYCPQAAATINLFPDEAKAWVPTGTPPPMEREDFLRRYAEADFRYIIASVRWENRRNQVAEARSLPFDQTATRFGRHLAPALEGLEPLFTDAFAAVYDGRVVLERLKALPASGPRP